MLDDVPALGREERPPCRSLWPHSPQKLSLGPTGEPQLGQKLACCSQAGSTSGSAGLSSTVVGATSSASASHRKPQARAPFPRRPQAQVRTQTRRQAPPCCEEQQVPTLSGPTGAGSTGDCRRHRCVGRNRCRRRNGVAAPGRAGEVRAPLALEAAQVSLDVRGVARDHDVEDQELVHDAAQQLEQDASPIAMTTRVPRNAPTPKLMELSTTARQPRTRS